MTDKTSQAVRLLTLINELDDQGAWPQLLIENVEGVKFPPPLDKQKAVLFNVSAMSVVNLLIDEEGVSFSARFGGGKEFTVYAPISAVLQVRSKDLSVIESLQHKILTTRPVIAPITKITYEGMAQVVPLKLKSTALVVQQPVEPIEPKKKFKVYNGAEQGDGKPRGALALVE